MPKYTNPYKRLYAIEPWTRIQPKLPTAVKHFLQAIDPEVGMIETTICLLVSKLIQSLHERNITNFNDIERYREFLANCELTDYATPHQHPLRGSTPSLPNNPVPPTAQGRANGGSAEVASKARGKGYSRQSSQGKKTKGKGG